MKNSNQDYITTLKLHSKEDLQKYILNKWLELVESDKNEHKIIALKELSKYNFNVQSGCHIPMSDSVETQDLF